MAARKTTKKRTKPHYVKSKKRKGADKTVFAKRTFVILFLVLFVVLILTGIGMGFNWIGRKLFSENPRFEIQHLEIMCDGRLREEQIREWGAVHEGMNLFARSFEEIRYDIKKSPWVESVELERKLPNTLRITVKERVPVARIQLSNKRTPRLMDRYGIVLAPRASPELARLPLIQGLDSDLRMGDQVANRDLDSVLEIIARCESNQNLHKHIFIESFDVKYDDYIDMRLEGGIRVLMPRYKLGTKLQELAYILQISKDQGRRVKQIDLTLESPKAPTTYY